MHTFYLYSKSSNAKIITVSEGEARYFIHLKNSLKGESVIFYESEKVLKLIDLYKAERIFSESGEDFSCEYYYSERLSDYIVLNGEKVNLHVCYRKDYIAVGTPLVFGSF